MPRICISGSGSVVFTRTLVSGLLAFGELRAAQLVLHDIDEERLDTARLVVEHACAEAGAEASIEAHTELDPALEGADYVIASFQVGGHEAILRDFDLPRRFGVRQTIGDTLGVGGIMRGLRTIPALLRVAASMERNCPDALLLNYVNPMAILVQALGEAFPGVRGIGLCYSVPNTVAKLSRIIGVPPEEVEYLAAGVNHQAWLLRFEHEGESLYPRLDAAIGADPELLRNFRVEMYRRFGYFMTESSEHSAEYVPWVMRHPDQLERYGVAADEKIRESEAGIAEYERLRDDLHAGRGFAPPAQDEFAPQIIHSLETGTPRLVYGNVPNHGLIDGLPENTGVEVPCHVDAHGLRPQRVGALPPQCAALNRSFLNVADLVVRAALEGRRDHVLHAALLDPNVGASLTIEQVAELVEALLEQHAAWIDPRLNGR